MALIDAPIIPICDLIPPSPGTLRVRFPFGIQLESLRASINRIPSADELIMAQLAQLNALLAPFAPIMVIAALLLALVNCVKAIPDAITSLSPSPIVDCLEELAKKLPLLFQFLPGIPYIMLIRDILGIMRRFVIELRVTLATIDRALLRQLRGLDIAEAIDDVTLVAEVQCAVEDSRQQTINLIATFSLFQTIMCALAIPLAILETFLPGDARRQVKNFRCSLKDVLGIVAVPGSDNVRQLITDLRAQIQSLASVLLEIQKQINALELILARLLGEDLDLVIEAPDCFQDCPST